MPKLDPKHKLVLEQLAVASLLLVFGATLFGALKKQGMLGGKPPASVQAFVEDARVAVGETGKAVDAYVKEMLQQAPAPSAGGSTAAPVRTYTAEALRDPLQSMLPVPVTASMAEGGDGSGSVVPSVEFPPVTVQGVIWGGARPQVIIEDHVYDVGDTVSGVRIKAIARDGITLELDGATTLVKTAQRPSGSL